MHQLVARTIEQQQRHAWGRGGRAVASGRPELPQAVGRVDGVPLAQGSPVPEQAGAVWWMARGQLKDGAFPGVA
jgi:hypothetical protein